tara:strand:- start:4734 stop:5627 length:894 start_codon:yes stop_codon:yes gene_type:complete
MSFHKNLVTADIHAVHAFEYADQAARLAAVTADFDATNDLNKIALQVDDQTIWMLSGISPSVVWTQIGGGVLSSAPVSSEAFHIANVTETTIPAISACVILDGTGWLGENENDMTVEDGGAVEYTGTNPKLLNVDAVVKMAPISATDSLSAAVGGYHLPLTTVTFTNATNLINETTTARVDGDIITFAENAGTLPAELRTDVFYYIVSKLTNSFQVSYTLGGAAITFTDDGSGTNTYQTADIHGYEPEKSVASNTAQEFHPQAILQLNANDKIVILVRNNDTSVNILATDAYIKAFG